MKYQPIGLSFLEEIEMERDNKILNVARFIKNEKATADALKAEKLKLADRQKVIENRITSMKSYLLLSLKDGEKVQDETAVVSIRNNAASVQLVDDFNIPEQFQRITVAADKTAIKDALKGGIAIEGASLVRSQSVTIK